MSTFDWYGNRVIQHHRSSRQSGNRQVHNIFVGTSKNPDFIPTAALREKFLAYISHICGAAKFFPRLAFGRTLNFRGALVFALMRLGLGLVGEDGSDYLTKDGRQ